MGVLDAEPGLAGADITIVCESYGGKMGVALAKELLGPKGDKKHKVRAQMYVTAVGGWEPGAPWGDGSDWGWVAGRSIWTHPCRWHVGLC